MRPAPCKACCAARPSSTAPKLRSFAIKPRRRLRSGRSRRSGPTSVMASRAGRMAGCGCAARPGSKSAILLPIYQAMEQVYDGDARGNPFAWLSEIGCPVRIATAGTPGPSIKRWRHAPSRCFRGEPMQLRRCRALRSAGGAHPLASGAGGVRDRRRLATNAHENVIARHRPIGNGGNKPRPRPITSLEPNQGSMETGNERVRSRPQ